MKYIKLMRPKHYIKNALILFPLIFSGRLLDFNLLFRAIGGVLAFSIISSVVYIINDIRDVENDRNHPTKSSRPIASRMISIKAAWIFAIILFVVSIFISVIVDKNYISLLIILLYFLLNLGYSLGLKNVPLLDIGILASGFLLRVLYGSALTNIEISNWLYLSVIAMSFYLGLGKRRNEFLRQNNSSTRKVLQFYNHSFLDKNMYMCLALTVVFYSLWSVDPLTVERLSNNYMIWTVPLILLICMKYSLAIEGNSDGDPVEVIFRDKWLLGMGLILSIFIMWIIYL